jgi:hypothetical protein
MEQLDLSLDDRRRASGPQPVSPELTEWDQRAYARITDTGLSPEQERRLVTPVRSYPEQDAVLGVHWHPEFLPLDLIETRIGRVFPGSDLSLLIPTQHNALMSLGGLAGAEVDCFSREFNRKVQLLLHFDQGRLARPGRLEEMISHTFEYRSSQLREYLATLVEPAWKERLEAAAMETGADEGLVRFAQEHARKLAGLIELNEAETPAFMLRNKLVESYFDELRALYDDRLIDRAQIFLKAVKGVVKANFSNRHFFQTREMIEEARGRGAGIVVPHPEQFWPVLLADYDVDGFEVWNPQSREYTEFLIDFVNRSNRSGRSPRRLLVFMGDDTHMSAKIADPRFQNREKAGREVGLQPAWEDPAVRRMLKAGGFDRRCIIEEYRSRLS